ncbi:hypothetical protein GCM10009676_36450 [Prauserella halophila]|uniref:Antirepressor protein ant N-terminal domain-containing protein n=1 Tax=Prauserella halophila TaxID=185641 RepID=A0ABN1WDJ8_9PSEU|nr:phage antirepressor N-terminal domain-containing protein [Prauserella halophila]MCP2234198.1 P22_AR N-terminal domain-containing protein [Prauserella halophila]
MADPTAPNNLVHIPFRGDDLLAVEISGKPHVVIKPALEAIGLDTKTQTDKLKSRSWAVTGQSPATGSDGKTYLMDTADVRTFLMLLATIDERRVGEHVRAKLVQYQSEVADVIEQYFTQGGAINPRATENQLAAIVTRGPTTGI